MTRWMKISKQIHVIHVYQYDIIYHNSRHQETGVLPGSHTFAKTSDQFTKVFQFFFIFFFLMKFPHFLISESDRKPELIDFQFF